MEDSNHRTDSQPEALPDNLEPAQVAAQDVESAGRSCLVIIGLALFILVLLVIWVLYTTA
jgi:CHASE3 domain sensor protein